jgi:hypothetical protein
VLVRWTESVEAVTDSLKALSYGARKTHCQRSQQ